MKKGLLVLVLVGMSCGSVFAESGSCAAPAVEEPAVVEGQAPAAPAAEEPAVESAA